MTLPKENMLWEFLVNNHSEKELKQNLKEMDFRAISDFLSECDKLGSEIIRGENPLFEKSAVSVILQIRKVAEKIGAKKLKEVMN